MKKTSYFLWPWVLILLTACSADPGTGTISVEWDHEGCKRCNMILSDQYHAAQVRHKPTNATSELHKFDDIGCAVIWLEKQSWKDDPNTEIWVNDYKTGSWIDARKASYLPGQQTPMQYGLGAQLEQTPEAMSFQEAHNHILKIEDYYKQHGAR